MKDKLSRSIISQNVTKVNKKLKYEKISLRFMQSNNHADRTKIYYILYFHFVLSKNDDAEFACLKTRFHIIYYYNIIRFF